MTDHWAVFALAATLERAEIAECEGAALRCAIARLGWINPTMVRHVMRDVPDAAPVVPSAWQWRRVNTARRHV